jgi:glycosyltransferase involved in cell wall biosynthesis
MTKSKIFNVAFLVDGSFLPIRNGANYSIFNLMNALKDSSIVDPSLIISYRGWDNPSLFYDQKFNTILLSPADYYNDTGILEYAASIRGVQFIHIYNSEEVLNMGLRLQRSGIKIIYEVINIDHILYGQLGTDKKKLQSILEMQKRACLVADYIMCRSYIDKQYLLKMGIVEEKIAMYKGAIDPFSIDFSLRKKPRNKIIFLGHMYYPPNEEALKLIVSKIIPQLKKIKDDYEVTIIGNTPKSTINKYKDVQGLIFGGGQDDLSGILKKFDIGIAPLYHGSGTRLKLLDYLASGLPIITTNIGAEGLDKKINDYFFIEDDINLYPDIINKIMSNLESTNAKSLLGRKFVENNYSWQKAVSSFTGVYKKLINNRYNG